MLLQDSHFYGELWFKGATIQLNINLTKAILDGLTVFSDSGIGRTLFLRDIKVGTKQGFKFFNCFAERILLDRSIVDGHLHPEQFKEYGAAAKEYAFLRTVFQNNNSFEDEDWAYYQFKRMSRKAMPLSWNPFNCLRHAFEYFFLDRGCGYGTKPFRTLYMCMFMIAVFAMIYFFGYFCGTLPERNYGIDNEILATIFYSFDISIIAFGGGYSDLTIDGSIRLFAMIEYLLGIVFVGLFIVAFSRKVIR